MRAGVTFYDAQDLARTDAKGFHGWTGGAGGTLKSALLYDAEPYSQTITVPASAVATPEEVQRLLPRPPHQVRGEPVD